MDLKLVKTILFKCLELICVVGLCGAESRTFQAAAQKICLVFTRLQ